ncbi:hypothetical protein PISMIDRAFT_8548 [Pisolithus microcarpus 441]|uniref:Uncharacterized protein n=1 Tax=Pisolithus microcarpus 441 TaxID=765257 RepID=A0A0C9YPR0_9AGAM|nr:hypothetical protein PISMIDRAFT_8548 [Pisolithus microcarpus 441]
MHAHLWPQFSQVTSSVIEAMVSVKRLSNFLHAEELQQDATTRVAKSSLSSGEVVSSIKGGEFAWTKSDVQPTLEDINLTHHANFLVSHGPRELPISAWKDS